MPIGKQDANRALELLEDYYNRLDSPEDQPLKDAIDRVMKVFKSRLFQALVDIQELYETILLDEQSDREAKVHATLQLAKESEKQSVLKGNRRDPTPANNESSAIATIIEKDPTIRPTSIKDDKRQPTPTPISRIDDTSDSIAHQTTPHLDSPGVLTQFSYKDHWTEVEINLRRIPDKSLGFSIAGGNDTPCIHQSPAVVVTRITKGCVAELDGRLKLYDIILRVNDTDFTNIEHQAAVNLLKSANDPVILKVRRLAPQSIEEIKLDRPPNVHLGFSIAGGIGHEHVKGDYGVFVTNIIPGGLADKNGRLKVGDRVMSVQSMTTTYDLLFVEHKHAVDSIRRACDKGHQITLTVGHPTAYSSDSQLRSMHNSFYHQSPATFHTDGHQSKNDDDDKKRELLSERRVLLERGPSGFGFNIISSEDVPGVFISFIKSGSPADKSGQLRKGDRILSVNNSDLREVSHERAGMILKNCGSTAQLHVIHQYNDFIRCQNRNDATGNRVTSGVSGSAVDPKILTGQFFVRAEFNYDPTNDTNFPSVRGLAFRKGDILHVVNVADDSWWQARRVIDEQEGELGVIPSKSRVTEKERARQEHTKTLDLDKKTKKKTGLPHKGEDVPLGEDSGNESENFEPVLSYQVVTRHRIDYARPILMFGSLTETLINILLNEHPNKFANCVPHTTRPKRETEVHGREYYFVSTREDMEEGIRNYLFIEAGEYAGHLYGTSIGAVRELANTSRHCVLDITGHAVKRLIKNGLYPIVIYVKPRSIKWILDNMEQGTTEQQAKQNYDKCGEIEQRFANLFTVTIEGEDLNDVYNRLCNAIDREQKINYLWVPSEEN